ncbi:MAG: alpha/beta fold hydrolase [Pseudomonadota bacterium]
MATRTPGTLSPPTKPQLLLESRAALDVLRMMPVLAGARLNAPKDNAGQPIMVIPGFGSGDSYTRPLRYFLKRLGYPAVGWGLGRNLGGLDVDHQQSDVSERWNMPRLEPYRREAGVPYVIDRLVERVTEFHREFDRPVTLIGWSLGGFMAREVARDFPELIDQVITMGSPTVGGPKYTAAADWFRQRKINLDWIERETAKRESTPISVPITAIVSRSDAIVGWGAAQDPTSPNVRHIEVSASHLGMGFNPTIWRHIREALARRGGDSAAQRAA